MKINLGFDAKRANANKTGLGNYSCYIISALANMKRDYALNLYVPKRKNNSEYDALFNISTDVKEQLPKAKFSKVFSALWRSRFVSKRAKEDGVQIFHGLSNELPLGLKKEGVKSVVTIHDLIFLRLPSHYRFFDRTIYNFKFKSACLNADKIIAISECTKRDIMEFYGIDESKIEIIYQGCDEQFSARFSDAEKHRVRNDYSLPKRFFLNVGTLEERKNLLLCVKALESLPEEIELVAIGRATKYTKRVMQYAAEKGLTNRIHLIHNCKYADLPIVYQMAEVFCYPSRYEGFGIPIIEALSSGIPTVAATGSCLEEAGGDAAIYVAPNDDKALAEAIQKFIDDQDLRATMVARGYEYIKRFTPAKIAEDLDKLYLDLLK